MKTIAVYTAYDWDHALVELRVTGPARHTGLEILHGTVGATTNPDLVPGADLVVLQRDFPRDMIGCAQVITLAKSQGVPIVYDLDDLIFDLPADHPDRAIHYYTDALIPMLDTLVAADAVTASTRTLCEVLHAYHPHTFHLPNYLNDLLWSFQPAPQFEPTQPVTIGYMGGASHAPDLETISPVLLAVAQEYGDRIRFHFWGGPPPASLAARPNVQWTELDLRYPAFAEYFSTQTCHIFIAPLQDNLFNRCKSPIKFLEYSSLGVPGVFSRIGPYAAAITHGQDGYLAGTTSEWEIFLRQLIDDPGARRAMGIRAQETVRDHWLLSAHAERWPDTYAEISVLPSRDPDPERGQVVAGARLRFQGEVEAKKATETRARSTDNPQEDQPIRSRRGRIRARLLKTLARLRRKMF